MEKIQKIDEEWGKILMSEQYWVLRRKGTEMFFIGEHCSVLGLGLYQCAGCGADLFRGQEKFESGTGWPSFVAPVSADAVETERDAGHGMTRTEVHCARCGGHLGHVFPDGFLSLGFRYCINSVSLKKAGAK